MLFLTGNLELRARKGCAIRDFLRPSRPGRASGGGGCAPSAQRAEGTIGVCWPPLLRHGDWRLRARPRMPATPSVSSRNALVAPAGTSSELIALLSRETRASLKTPQAREQAHRAGHQVAAGTPEQLAARLASEIPPVKELVARLGIKSEEK